MDDVAAKCLPQGWEDIAVGDIAAFSSGRGISVSTLRAQSSDFPYPVFGGNGVAGYTDVALVEQPTVAIGRVGQKCGEVHVTPGPSWITDNALHPTTIARSVDVRFLALALRAARLNDSKNRNDLPLITQSILHSVRLAWPSDPDEQRAIVEAIEDVDGLLVALDQLIAKKRDLKQAAMQQVLTGRTRLPGFKGEWQQVCLGELGVFLKGRGVRRDEAQSGDLPCIRYGEIYTHHNEFVREFNSWVAPEVASTATRLMPGDLLFAGSGETKEEIGKCVAFIQSCEAYAGGDIVILRAQGTDPLFMGYLCNTSEVSKQKASRGQGDAVVHISAAALSGICVRVPLSDEQTAIAAILSDMDAEIAALEARRAKTRDLKQAMMQELLTGRTRLV